MAMIPRAVPPTIRVVPAHTLDSGNADFTSGTGRRLCRMEALIGMGRRKEAGKGRKQEAEQKAGQRGLCLPRVPAGSEDGLRREFGLANHCLPEREHPLSSP